MHRREFLRSTASCLGALAFPRGFWAPGFRRRRRLPQISLRPRANGIYLSQIGFLPDIRSRYGYRTTQFLCCAIPEDNSVAFRSTLSSERQDAASGDIVRLADFSPVKLAGDYRIELDTGVRGGSFAIGKDAYDHALLVTMRSFYGQRCGYDVDLGGGYAHPKCHMEAAFILFGKNRPVQ